MLSPSKHESAEALVREADNDRYLAGLIAPPEKRGDLFALYAFNHEVAKIAETVSQPVMGQIRLQWWRDVIEEIYARTERRHEVVQALAATIRAHDLPRALFDAAIDARENDLDEAPFADWTSLESYADATSGNVMRLGLRVLGGGAELNDIAREAGTAYALAGLLRALPFHAARRRLMLPAQALREASLSQEQIFSGNWDEKVTALYALVVARAREHLSAAKKYRVARAHLPAFIPAALSSLYLKRMTRPAFNPFRDSTAIPVYRRQLAMLTAMLRGRL